MLRLAFDFIITWRETRTRPNAYVYIVGRGESNPGGFLRFLISLSHFLFTNFPAVPAAPARFSGLPVIR